MAKSTPLLMNYAHERFGLRMMQSYLHTMPETLRHHTLLAIIQFSDLTVAEYSKMMLGTRPNLKRNATWPPRRPAAPASSEAMDDSVDWIERGAVTGVKNQGQCGGCWAFATTGAVEGAYAIATGSLVSLSEEQILACDSSEEGCGGGNPEQALDWIHQNGGICSESSWPYDSSGGDVDTCSTSCTNVVTVGGYEAVPEGDEDALVDALRSAPVAVAIEADTTNFQLYQSGVYDNPDCFSRGQVDHGVLLVGFGNDDTGTPFYKLKNSWATTWGESGYMRLARGGNICGVASKPTYATSAAAAGGGGGPTPPAPTPGPAPRWVPRRILSIHSRRMLCIEWHLIEWHHAHHGELHGHRA